MWLMLLLLMILISSFDKEFDFILLIRGMDDLQMSVCAVNDVVTRFSTEVSLGLNKTQNGVCIESKTKQDMR